ncbi:hypothetical protein P152DRAFT_456852 [Eremomyces bilateralis CBS 781.70]|uniref:Uncharacterized protein n=1 Tax=Eremomyces bilateralis CBS 781.70 TaxID=1392243 RepID=A0A6G1G988_9PEZI|nr:uncharacterized protein P152DRAFT_456852 [Eremomyces bilateralis CBS 781.70]KAF1814583.1 hypothetical protein P152DRAFT_456852 [Eremomyces bilateralis CBS 781.70]
MVKIGGRSVSQDVRHEKLVVKWRTCGKSSKNGNGAFVSGAVRQPGGIASTGAKGDQEGFTGLFIFEFDEEGRIVKHIIEQADEGENYDKTARVISVTDWLLGRAWGKKEEAMPGLAFGCCRSSSDDGGSDRQEQMRANEGVNDRNWQARRISSLSM